MSVTLREIRNFVIFLSLIDMNFNLRWHIPVQYFNIDLSNTQDQFLCFLHTNFHDMTTDQRKQKGMQIC